jgi:putative flippase GtrA
MTAPTRPIVAATLHRQASGTSSSRPGGPAATLRERVSSRIGRELLVFAAIGVASTAAYALLYLLLRGIAGPVAANAVALLVTAVGNTAANRRFTFGVRDRRRAGVIRDQLAGLAALGVALVITTSAAAALDGLAPDAGRFVELAVLVFANGLATVTRFVLLRAVITRGRATHEPHPATDRRSPA